MKTKRTKAPTTKLDPTVYETAARHVPRTWCCPAIRCVASGHEADNSPETQTHLAFFALIFQPLDKCGGETWWPRYAAVECGEGFSRRFANPGTPEFSREVENPRVIALLLAAELVRDGFTSKDFKR